MKSVSKFLVLAALSYNLLAACAHGPTPGGPETAAASACMIQPCGDLSRADYLCEFGSTPTAAAGGDLGVAMQLSMTSALTNLSAQMRSRVEGAGEKVLAFEHAGPPLMEALQRSVTALSMPPFEVPCRDVSNGAFNLSVAVRRDELKRALAQSLDKEWRALPPDVVRDAKETRERLDTLIKEQLRN